MSQDQKPAVGRDSDKFMLRFPEGMRERIADLAKANGRSMNAEIVSRIEQSMSREGDWEEVVTLAFRVAHLELQQEFRRMELAILANKLLTVVARCESFGDHGTEVLSNEEAKSFREDAERFATGTDDLEKNVLAKLESVRTLGAKVHGMEVGPPLTSLAEPTKVVKRISRKAAPKG
ncbi:hypothetical protein RCH14_000390 [Massilia sp. MP_M2]|uniref:Arc family DNA-binding protein n=1 Tax=Massilia sp. MP_M2 TaxID=3071713 RepID=UPI00319E6809